MKLEGQRESDNVEDRRGRRATGMGVSAGVVFLVIVVSVVTGADPRDLLQALEQGDADAVVDPAAPEASANDGSARFIKKVLASTEDTWRTLMPDRYQEPRLVLFRGGVDSACGFADSAVGPFYCPADSQVYLDLAFFDALDAQLGAPGDFAQAYVVAHEIGHHIQNLTGTKQTVASQPAHKDGPDGSSVRLELQADCLAGVWGHTAQQRGLLDQGDVEEALRAAAAIGDDTLARQSGGRVVPDSFTHGTSAQRLRWFKLGMQTGDPARCDTFGTNKL